MRAGTDVVEAEKVVYSLCLCFYAVIDYRIGVRVWGGDKNFGCCIGRSLSFEAEVT